MTPSNFPISPKMDRGISDMSKNGTIVKKMAKPFFTFFSKKWRIFFFMFTGGVVLMLGV
jgi:hypothetical protein